MELMRARGTRDFLPEEKALRENIVETLKEVFELYGFNAIETPTMERIEVLAAKFAAGKESDALKETFKLKDQGGRELGLKYDLTVPLARVIGMNPNLKMPFKRYQIERVYRDGPVEGSRYREFLQCDVDVVGVKSVAADAEILALVQEAFKRLGIKAEIRLNSRKLLSEMLEKAGVQEEKKEAALVAIDKLEKYGKAETEKELKEKGLEEEQIRGLLKAVSIEGSSKEALEKITQILGQSAGVKEVQELLEYCTQFGVKVKFAPSLARGLAYYTGPIFEVFAEKGKVKSSIAGGGRWDKMISGFLETGKEFPATGISFGIERIFDELKEKEKSFKGSTDFYIITVGLGLEQGIGLAQKLREMGIKTDLDLQQRGISKNLEYASSKGIPFALILGEKELKAKELTLRDMKSGKQRKVKMNRLQELKRLVKK